MTHYMTWRNGSTGTSIGCWVWIVCASSIHPTASVLAIPFSSESIISISIIIRIYSSARQIRSEYLGNPLNRVRRRKICRRFSLQISISNKQTILSIHLIQFRSIPKPASLAAARHRSAREVLGWFCKCTVLCPRSPRTNKSSEWSQGDDAFTSRIWDFPLKQEIHEERSENERRARQDGFYDGVRAFLD